MKSFRYPQILAMALGGFFVQASHAEVLTQDVALKLMTKSGCATCHAIDKQRMGPAYKDVAKMYAKPDAETTARLGKMSPVEYITERVRKGVKIPEKHWKKSIGMMTPNPVGRISDADLKKLIEYILSLK